MDPILGILLVTKPFAVEVEHLTFAYPSTTGLPAAGPVVRDLSFCVEQGEWVCIQGPSGSGKSTLFYLLGLLLEGGDTYHGAIRLFGCEVKQLDALQKAQFRRKYLGFVFQQFHLLPKLTVAENIQLSQYFPLEITTENTQQPSLAHISTTLKIDTILKQVPNTISGGQAQRVAMARALFQDAKLILADEPTGSLDSVNSAIVLDLFQTLKDQGHTIVMITHDPTVAARADRILYFADGTFQKSEVVREAKPSPRAVNNIDLVPRRALVSSQYLKRIWAQAWGNIRANRVKSFLNVLGVFIGVMSLVAMIIMGRFLDNKLRTSYESIGVNRLTLNGYPVHKKGKQKRSSKAIIDDYKRQFREFALATDIPRLKNYFSEIESISPRYRLDRPSASIGGKSLGEDLKLYGVASEYFLIADARFFSGRPFVPAHVEREASVCVIGRDIARNIQRITNTSDVLGQLILLSDNNNALFSCRVLGVLDSVTDLGGRPADRDILMPYTYFRKQNFNWWATELNALEIKVRSGSKILELDEQIRKYIRFIYGNSGDFWVESGTIIYRVMSRMLFLFSVLLILVSVLSLIVGGIGVYNMLKVSVNERMREFGLKMSLGATPQSLADIVMMESQLLTLSGAVIGIVAAYVFCHLLLLGAGFFLPALKFEWVFDGWAIVAGLGMAIGIGYFSGRLPAREVKRLQVIQALRAD